MTEIEKIFYTACLTIIGGVFLFILQKFLELFIFKPIMNYKNIIREIEYSLIFFCG